MTRLRDDHTRNSVSNTSRARKFFFSKMSIPTLGTTNPPIQYVPGGVFQNTKRHRRETGHLPLSAAEFKNEWRFTYVRPCAFMTCIGMLRIHTLCEVICLTNLIKFDT
jgi:hypothetical protein